MVKLYEDWLEEAFADKHSKNVYVELQSKDVQEYEKDITDLIVNAYKHVGGNEIKTPNDLRRSDITYWIAKDIDVDPDVDIVIGGKTTPAGTKITVMGQDGERDSKSDIVKKVIDMMKTRGFYAEMDVDLAQKFGLPSIKDEATIVKVLKKDIKYLGDGSYERVVKGLGNKRKVLVGIPKI